VRILHVTSDWKWTGPAAPMLQLLLAQRARGCTAELVCPEDPDGRPDSLPQQARAAGVEPVLELARARGAIWWRDSEDARRLAGLLARRRFDVVHTWHTRDHVIAVRATAEHRRNGATRLVRSHRSADPIAGLPWNRWLFGRATDGLLCVSPRAASRNQRLRRGRPVLGALGAVDLARFAPRAPDARLRASLGLAPEHRVIGITARVQRHRRFDLLLAAMARLTRELPQARLLVVGRGTHLEETARRPAARLGLAEHVVFAGYRTADYPAVLGACDLFTMLVPGSDGGCRALLEAAAAGLPAVVTDLGTLPEIVVHGETGRVVLPDPARLADAWRELLEDAPLRQKFGAAARQRAELCFSPARLAEEVESLYRAALGAPPP
jgi:glycosyltransferase involved in cell wall biosynthesis